MEHDELLRRCEDLARRGEKSGQVTATHFLTPAEQAAVKQWAVWGCEGTVLFHGGSADCERQAAFFLPYYMDEADFNAGEYIRCVHLKAGFGTPEHRDYLGAVLGLGIERAWIGDIRILGEHAWVFCLPSVESHLVSSLDKVGRYGVKTESCPLSSVPIPERKVKRVSFTVKSARLDAVAAGMFHLSRTEAAKLIGMGLATVNYLPCERVDAMVKAGDVISLRGHGKGTVSPTGAVSRKDRLFMEAEIYI